MTARCVACGALPDTTLVTENQPLPEVAKALRTVFKVDHGRDVATCDRCGRYFVRRAWTAKEPWVLGEDDTWNEFESVRPISTHGVHAFWARAKAGGATLPGALPALPLDLPAPRVVCPKCGSSEVDLDPMSGTSLLASCHVCLYQQYVEEGALGAWSRA